MNHAPFRGAAMALALALCALFASGFVSGVQAGPGAHGPNGEHLDAPTAVGGTVQARPRLEAQTELFELVATLHDEELSVLIDRWATNEPVLRGTLTVESGGVKAQARFHEDHGDYAVDDPKLLKLLASPGEHALVFTLVAGEGNDLIDGTLRVAAADADHGHAHWQDWAAALSGVLGLLGLGAVVIWRRRAAKGGF